MAPEAVATVYARPEERVVLFPERDYNVAFALYESIWMMAGRSDTAPLDRYVSDYTKRFSDDGVNQRGAYGERWIRYFGRDQIEEAVAALSANSDDRRVVIQMWDAGIDCAAGPVKDVPCNLTATLQVGVSGNLELTVFCRSNDIVYGAYFANAFHFSVMQAFVASRLGLRVGTYTQISVNYHAYRNVLDKFAGIPKASLVDPILSPYETGEVLATPVDFPGDWYSLSEYIDSQLWEYLDAHSSVFVRASSAVLKAHALYKDGRIVDSLETISEAVAKLGSLDVLVSMRQWLNRRYANHMRNLIMEDVG